MLVREHMTENPITILPSASVEDALHLMAEKNIRHLPVMDFQGRLLGVVSEYDLAYVSPSPVTSLSVQDVLYHLAHLKVDEIMTREVVTVEADCPLEEAAGLMIDHGISALPVVQDGCLVGIITQTDVFRLFLEMLEPQMPGIRLSLLIPDQGGMIARLSERIAAAGGNIMSLGQFEGPDAETRRLTLKVADVPSSLLRTIVDECGFRLLDLRGAAPSAGRPG